VDHDAAPDSTAAAASPRVVPHIELMGNPVAKLGQFRITGAAIGGALEIYNPLGRLVDLVRLDEPDQLVLWSPQVASGIYFAKLREQSATPIKFLVVK
jgi:hypothetical protein